MKKLISSICILVFLTISLIQACNKNFSVATYDLAMAIVLITLDIQDDTRELKNGN